MPELIVEKGQEGVVLDHEHPWPGLVSFTEANQLFFFGREREVVELARLVRQETLTVFFGKSGLGKSSILRAGLSPLLRESEFVPVYIRLNHDETAPSLKEQVEIAIDEALKEENIDAAKVVRAETLWEYFHKKNNDWWDTDNRLVKPVLIFDQFEELMTLGQENPDRSSRTASFLSELEDLVENRPPASLVERFKREPALADQFDHRRSDYRIILSLREDFLPDLEGLRDRLRSIMFNRLRLLPMNGEQALDVILKPGRNLVDEGVAIRIVDFISSSERSRLQKEVTRAQIAKRAIEPALLSVVLQELNSRRIQAGNEKLTAELVGKTNPTEIFYDFYLRGLEGMDGTVREFIEDYLLTSSGARNRIAEEDALTKAGISSEIISKLIDRRIVQRETAGNTKWLELTHDTLADVVRTDRAEHHQQRELELVKASEKEARARLRRVQKLAAGFAVLLLIAAVTLWLLTIRVEEQADGALTLLKKESAAPAPGAPDRVKSAISRLSQDASHFFFLRRLKLTYGQALAYGAEICYFNGYLEDGCRYSRDAVRTLSHFGPDPATAIPRAHANYARAEGALKKGQLRAAEEDFRSATKLTDSAPQSATSVEERNRIHFLAKLGLAEVKSAQDLRSEAETIFNEVRSEVKTVFHTPAQKNSIEALMYEVRALNGLGIIRERSSQVNDDGSKETRDIEDFLEQADTEISKCVSQHPDNVTLRNVQANTAYWRIFFLAGSSRENSNYAPVATRLRDALSKGESLASLDQQNRSWKLLLAQNYRLQGMVWQNAHEDIIALEAFEKMRELTQDIQRDEPSWFINNYCLTIAESYVADCLSTISTTHDERTFQDRLAKISRDGESDFGKAAISLSAAIAEINKTGDLPSRQKRSSEAIADYRLKIYGQVRKQLEKLLRDAPGNAEYERTTALTINFIADQETSRGRLAAALTAYREALILLNGMPAEVAKLSDIEALSASINESLGGALIQVGGEENIRLALDCRSKALQIRGDLVKSQASVYNLASLAGAYIYVGDVYLAQNNKEKTEELYLAAMQVYEQALTSGAANLTGDPSILRRQQLFRSKAQSLNYMAYKWRTVGNFEAAAAMLRPAIESAKEVFRADPLNTEVISFLKGIKGDEKSPNWASFCTEKLSDPKLGEADRTQLKSISQLLDQSLPSQVPEPASPGESLNWGILPLIPGSWHNLGPKEQKSEISYLARSDIQPPIDTDLVTRIRTLGLPCYPDTNLYEVEIKKPNSDPSFLNYIRHGDGHGWLRDFSSIEADKARAILSDPGEEIDGVRLDGTKTPIELFNSRHHPILENEISATVYLRLFCAALQGPKGAFHIIDSQGDLHWRADAKDTVRQYVERRIYPFKISATTNGWEAKATIAYSNWLSYTLLQLSPDGTLYMPGEASVEDSLIQENLKILTRASENKKWQEGIDSLKTIIDLLKQGGLPIVPEKFVGGVRTVSQSRNEEQRGPLGNKLADYYSSLAWFQLHIKDFSGALESTEAGLKLQPGDLPLQTNQAHALLFLRRTAEAEKIYRGNIGKPVELNGKKQTWEQVILDDFDQLEKDGISSPQFNRVREILKKGGR